MLSYIQISLMFILKLLYLYRSSAHQEYDTCRSFYNNQLQQPEVTVNVESPIV